MTKQSSQYVQLASKSPRRRELLAQIGVSYQLVDVDVPEEQNVGEGAEAYVSRLAQSKAKAGFEASPHAVTLGADTIVVCDDVVLEKPRDEADCLAMLGLLSGRSHQVMTAMCLYDGDKVLTRVSHTHVRFKVLTDALIRAYWRTGEPVDKAGAYGIQGKGALFVHDIQGSYTCVVGLAIEPLSDMLAEFGVAMWYDHDAGAAKEECTAV